MVSSDASRREGTTAMSNEMTAADAALERVHRVSFGRVSPMYVAKAEKQARSKREVDKIIRWLTGYTQRQVMAHARKETEFETFFADAPAMNPARELVTGVVCGVRVENIDDRVLREVRYLDKLIDELARGNRWTGSCVRATPEPTDTNTSTSIDGCVATVSRSSHFIAPADHDVLCQTAPERRRRGPHVRRQPSWRSEV